jgi:hypothetical protein
MARNLVWTGAAGDQLFGSPGNWTNIAAGKAAKKAPGAATHVEIDGTGTILGSGSVDVLDVASSGGGVFQLGDGTITANAVMVAGRLQLMDEQLRANTITIGSDAQPALLDVGAGSSLLGKTHDLNITVSGAPQAPNGATLQLEEAAQLVLGGGTLQIGVGTGAGGSNDGTLYGNGSILSGGARAAIMFGADGGSGSATLFSSTIAIGGMLAVGTSNGNGFLRANGGQITAGQLDVGADGTGTATLSAVSTTLTGRGGVGLSVGATLSALEDQPKCMLQVSRGALTVHGATEIGVYGSGELIVDGVSLITTGGVLVGTGDGTGTLAVSGTWQDTGSVLVGRGELDFYATGTGTIAGDLTLRESSDLNMNGAYVLDVTGTMTLGAPGSLTGHSFALLQDGGTIDAGNLVVSGYSTLEVNGGGFITVKIS